VGGGGVRVMGWLCVVGRLFYCVVCGELGGSAVWCWEAQYLFFQLFVWSLTV
jgi:hypothetical protein